MRDEDGYSRAEIPFDRLGERLAEPRMIGFARHSTFQERFIFCPWRGRMQLLARIMRSLA